MCRVYFVSPVKIVIAMTQGLQPVNWGNGFSSQIDCEEAKKKEQPMVNEGVEWSGGEGGGGYVPSSSEQHVMHPFLCSEMMGLSGLAPVNRKLRTLDDPMLI